MPSNEKKVSKDTEVVEVNGEVEYNTGKDAEEPKKVNPMTRPPPHSSKIREKDPEW